MAISDAKSISLFIAILPQFLDKAVPPGPQLAAMGATAVTGRLSGGVAFWGNGEVVPVGCRAGLGCGLSASRNLLRFSTAGLLCLATSLGGRSMVNYNIPHIAQNFEFDCWYAALRMIVKFRNGNAAEPIGLEAAETAGMERQSLRDGMRNQMHARGENPGAYQNRRQLQQVPPIGLRPDQFTALAQRNGLVAPLLPPPPAQGGGFTFERLDALLRVHGPLWCAFGYGHIVVLKGAVQGPVVGTLYVHDPQGGANHPYTDAQFNNLLAWDVPNCLMFLPGTPNANAFNG